MLTGVWRMQRMTQLKVVSLLMIGARLTDEIKAQDVSCYTLQHFKTLDFALKIQVCLCLLLNKRLLKTILQRVNSEKLCLF